MKFAIQFQKYDKSFKLTVLTNMDELSSSGKDEESDVSSCAILNTCDWFGFGAFLNSL